MEALTPWHLLLILAGFMLLFGYKKLPDATRSLGRSLRIFKSEIRELNDAGPAATPAATPVSTGAALSVAELETQAREAEAQAAALRARAQTHGGHTSH